MNRVRWIEDVKRSGLCTEDRRGRVSSNGNGRLYGWIDGEPMMTEGKRPRQMHWKYLDAAQVAIERRLYGQSGSVPPCPGGTSREGGTP